MTSPMTLVARCLCRTRLRNHKQHLKVAKWLTNAAFQCPPQVLLRRHLLQPRHPRIHVVGMDVHSRNSAGHRIVHVRVDGVHSPISVLLAPDVRSIDHKVAQMAPPLVLGFIPLMPRRIDLRPIPEHTRFWAHEARHAWNEVPVKKGCTVQVAWAHSLSQNGYGR